MAVSTTSHSKTRMRALVRWSDNSFSRTVPSPWKGEPSRRIAYPLTMPGILVEVAGVDHFETGLLEREPGQSSAHGDHFARGVRPHVAISCKPEAVRSLLLDFADTRDQCQPLCETNTLRFDFNGKAPAEHLPAEFRHCANERDAAGAEQRDPVAHDLHAL